MFGCFKLLFGIGARLGLNSLVDSGRNWLNLEGVDGVEEGCGDEEEYWRVCFSFIASVDKRWRLRVPRNEAVYHDVRPGLCEVDISQGIGMGEVSFTGSVARDYTLTIPKIYRSRVNPAKAMEVDIRFKRK